MIKIYSLLLFALLCITSIQSMAQYGGIKDTIQSKGIKGIKDSIKPKNIQPVIQPPVKVAIFVPLYLPDAFTGTTYKLTKTSIPKNILPGLEFYNGVMMALDSLNMEYTNVDVEIFDTKQTEQSLSTLLNKPSLGNVGLMIAAISNTDELDLFSNIALQKNIPMISATYPNFVGINQNPFFVLLNSAFTTHIEGMYKYMQRNLPTENIIGIKKKGNVEDYIKRIITDLNKNTQGSKVNIKWLEVDENVTTQLLAPYLDSLKSNYVFVASPLESFGLNVVRTLNYMPEYRTTALGMPTWDGISQMNRSDCKNVEIVYSTPFSYVKTNPLVSYISKNYKNKYYSRPSDMVFKGFEVTYHFIKLLDKHRYNLVNNLSDKDFTVFNQFEIAPIKRSENAIKPDYLENKKLYFITKQQGNIKSVY